MQEHRLRLGEATGSSGARYCAGDVAGERGDSARAFEAFNHGGVEEALPRFAPDIVLYALPEWPGPSEYRGHHGIRALMTEWTENFDDFEMEVGETRNFLTWRDALEAAGLSE